jgi:hypothetical protein
MSDDVYRLQNKEIEGLDRFLLVYDLVRGHGGVVRVRVLGLLLLLLPLLNLRDLGRDWVMGTSHLILGGL